MAASGRPAGRAGSIDANFTAGLTEPVTPQDVAALFAVLPNTGIGYDRWVRIAFACWAVVYQSNDPDAEQIVHDSFVEWSLAYPHASRGDRDWVDPEKTWKSTRKVRDIGDTIFVNLARSIDFWLPSRVAASTSYGLSASGSSVAAPSARTAMPAGALLLKRIRAHHRLALCRGRLEAERTVYRILIAEPPQSVLAVIGKVVRFMLDRDTTRRRSSLLSIA